MKQTMIFIALFALTFSKIYCQELDTSNVYFKCLKMHLLEKDEFYKNNPKLKRDEIFVEKNEYATNKIPNIISGKEIKILGQEEIYKLLKTQKLISVIAIRPATWKNGSLKISIIDFLVIKSGKKLGYTNTGGNEFEINNFSFKKLNRLQGNYD